jgi:predicted small lipoprotein YifL/plastocyanin
MMRTKLSWYTSLAMTLVLAGCGGGAPTPPAEQAKETAPAAAPVDPATAATITGKVSFEGAKPTMPRIRMDAVPACTEANKEPVFSQEVEVNDNGTLRDVYVYVKEGLGDRAFPVPTESVALEQKGCQYHPHVLGLMAGQKLAIKNDDPTNHNIHPMPAQNREWNQSQPPGSPVLEQEFARPEVMVPVKCNVHPWMKAYIGVQKHPFFAVTGADGTYTIKGLPPGDYTIETWQEKYGAQTSKVTVAPSESKTLDFSYKG